MRWTRPFVHTTQSVVQYEYSEAKCSVVCLRAGTWRRACGIPSFFMSSGRTILAKVASPGRRQDSSVLNSSMDAHVFVY